MRPRLVLAIALLATSLCAQTVHVVGPGGFAQIQQAINAASNGDVVVIQSGTYQSFTLSKDLTLTAAPGAVVDVAPWMIFAPCVTVFQPPALAKVTGIRFRTAPSLLAACHTRVDGGMVYFADCAFESSPTQLSEDAALRAQNARVALQRCVLVGGGATPAGAAHGVGCSGLSALHASIAAADSLFLGCNLGWDFVGHGGHGVLVDDSDVHLANCIAVGGDNASLSTSWSPGNGVHVVSTSRVWLADCQLRGGNAYFFGAGGSGLVNLGTTAAQQARSSFFGGPGTPPGAPVIGPLVTAPLLGLMGTTPPITIGAPWSIGYRTAPATPVLALFSDALSTSVLPLVTEPVWLPANAFAVAGLGVTDPNGVVTFTFVVPSTPSLLHASCFVQAFAGVTLPLEAAPPVGGVVR